MGGAGNGRDRFGAASPRYMTIVVVPECVPSGRPRVGEMRFFGEAHRVWWKELTGQLSDEWGELVCRATASVGHAWA